MRALSVRSVISAAAILVAVLSSSAFASSAGDARPAASSVKWTKISTQTGLGIASAGIYRTADGRLHVVWTRNDHAKGFSLHYSTLGSGAKLLKTGAIVGGWSSLTTYPRLVAGPNGGIRLVFTGANGKNGSPFNEDTMYSATAGKAGQTWALTTGSMSQSKLVPLTDDAAATESSGTPVAGWSAGAAFDFHVGTDPATPSTAPDHSVGIGAGGVVVGPTLARDSSGHLWAGWFDGSFDAKQGYYAVQIVPSVGAKLKAPGSGGKTLANNQPLESVALAARTGGGVYLAYCVPSKTVQCTHVALWKVGSARAKVVPGSATGHASHVAIAAGPSGHLSIAWYDSGSNKIKEVRTNGAVSAFGKLRTISAPPSTIVFDGLELQGSTGPLDLVALTLQNKSGAQPAYWAAQIKP
jgi:hypothetical protein